MAPPTECTEQPLLAHPLSLMHWPCRGHQSQAQPSPLVKRSHCRALNSLHPPFEISGKPQHLLAPPPPCTPPVPRGSSPAVNKHDIVPSMVWAIGLRGRDHDFQIKSPSTQVVAHYWNVLHFVFQEKYTKKTHNKKNKNKKNKSWIQIRDVLQKFVLQCSN